MLLTQSAGNRVRTGNDRHFSSDWSRKKREFFLFKPITEPSKAKPKPMGHLTDNRSEKRKHTIMGAQRR